MNIKKVDDKPMVIHTKEKAKLHTKGKQETKIKGRNVLTVQRGPKIVGEGEELKKKSSATDKGKQRQAAGRKGKSGRQDGKEKGKENTAGIERGNGAGAKCRNMDKGRGAANAAKKTAKTAAKESAKTAAKETAKTTARAAAATAGTAAGTATTGVGGVLIGAAAGDAAGMAMDKRDLRNSTRNRMIKLFVAKLRQEENQDSIGKALKDIALMRFSMMAKYVIRYAGLFLLALFALVAVVALPVIAVIAIIYNSPLAIFFPSISSGETTQEVLSAYAAEFNRDINAELADISGYDESERIYVDFEGAGTPDNYCDILAVYMVKYGNGDTATDMTDKAKANLKSVFDDMCSYTITSRTDEDTDDEGNTTTTKVKEVRVTLKTYHDMISVYGFNAEEQEMLEELMKPEYLAMLGYTGGGGDPGESLSPERECALQLIFSAVKIYLTHKAGYSLESPTLRESTAERKKIHRLL